ncbi:MFS general substrate transporter [Gigaspora margarita]|uniref:MFS general substrate transporter n=1 Tax=Gigaspora margarita TaxID=4874 RepID=A0A8H4AI81_GIGMA|nr:MFS general substrate transporter [Gigaspora margarita]
MSTPQILKDDIDEKVEIKNLNANVEEKKLLRKFDIRIMPLLMILMCLCFLDRINIGNAKIAHLEKDLNLNENEFQWALSIFFFGYIVFEIPSNIILIKIRPSIWLSLLTLGWGIVMITMSFANNELFTFIEKNKAIRISLVISALAISGAFGGLLAFSITNLNGRFGLNGWRWKASWLTDDEKKLAIDRLQLDAGDAYATHFDKSQIIKAFMDWKIYIGALINMAVLTPTYAFSVFIPSIVNGLGFNTVDSQLLATPPFILGCFVSIPISILSDRFGRCLYLIPCMLITIVGYALLMVRSGGIAIKFLGACFVGTGLFSCLPITSAWVTNNLAGDSKRAVGCAIFISLSSIGGATFSLIYRSQDAPAYIFGHTVSLSILIFAIVLSILQYCLLNFINKRKLKNPDKFLEGKNEEEIMNLGDMHPSFIYRL